MCVSMDICRCICRCRYSTIGIPVVYYAMLLQVDRFPSWTTDIMKDDTTRAKGKKRKGGGEKNIPFNLLFSPKNPTSPSVLLLTRLTTTASFSRPWKPSTLPNSIPGQVSLSGASTASCLYSSQNFISFSSSHVRTEPPKAKGRKTRTAMRLPASTHPHPSHPHERPVIVNAI